MPKRNIWFTSYVFSPTSKEEEGQEGYRPPLCIQCITTQSTSWLKPGQNAKLESTQRRALLLIWRMTRVREDAWLTKEMETNKNWLLTFIGKDLTVRERQLIEDDPQIVAKWQADDHMWDGTYFLMVRIAWLPPDLFRKLLAMI